MVSVMVEVLTYVTIQRPLIFSTLATVPGGNVSVNKGIVTSLYMNAGPKNA